MSNIIKNYSEFIGEGLTSKVFHFTYLHNLVNILKSNSLQTTSTLSSPHDFKKNNGNFFYLSLTSSGNSDIGYASSMTKDHLVRLTIDGRKLNYNYKSKRVDYWNRPRDPRDPLYDDFRRSNDSNSLYKLISRQDELEDRIMTDDPVIMDINKYIIDISILMDSERDSFTDNIKKLRECDQMSKELNIPFNVYTDSKSFDFNITERSVDLYKISPTTPEYEYIQSGVDISTWVRILALITYQEDDLRNIIFDDLRKGDFIPSEYKVGDILDYIDRVKKKDSYDYLDYSHIDVGRYDYPISGYISSMEADIHNDKSKSNSFKHYVLGKLTREMKKHNCKTLFEYVKYKLSIRP